jgi:hypothetical protein
LPKRHSEPTAAFGKQETEKILAQLLEENSKRFAEETKVSQERLHQNTEKAEGLSRVVADRQQKHFQLLSWYSQRMADCRDEVGAADQEEYGALQDSA